MPADEVYTAIEERRLRRLGEELADESVPLPTDGATGRRLLAELAYARRPVQHEHHVPGYGALVFQGVPDWDACTQVPLVLAAPEVPPAVLRRYADGRSSFVVATGDGLNGIATFEHSVEDEAAAVRLQRSGAVVVQRTREGAVRVCAAHGVVVWNGSRWMFKPRAEDYVRALRLLAPHADPAVLSGLLELAVHSLASVRVGTSFVWNLDGRPADDPRNGLLELGRAIVGPPLSVVRRSHFPAIVSVESQVDLATVVAADGSVGPIGVRLDHSGRAASVVPPTGGARHTSARRFSFDVPQVLVVVVSESGRVTVFSGGAVAAEIGPDRYDELGPRRSPDMPPGGGEPCCLTCEACARPLLAVHSGAPRAEGPVACPVCDGGVALPPGYVILGVPVHGRDVT
jgi:DNA integrity scanning protein DisA with diadenylate cyclase activity